MTKIRIKYLHTVTGKDGRKRYYFRRKGYAAQPLPAPTHPAFMAAWTAAMAQEPLASTPRLRPRSLEELIENWQRTRHYKSLAPNTRATYARLLHHMQAAPYAPFLVTDFASKHIHAFIEAKGDRPSQANATLKMFRLLFDHAIVLGWREDNPASCLKRLRVTSLGYQTWSDAELQRFEEHWPSGSHPRLAFALLLYTGQRGGDVVQLGPKNRKGDVLHLRQNKTGTLISLPLHPKLRTELDQIREPGETYLTNSQGGAMSPKVFIHAFRKWRQEAGLPEGLTAHGIRKATARKLAEAGCSPHEIAAITGHKSLREVERYTQAANRFLMAHVALGRM